VRTDNHTSQKYPGQWFHLSLLISLSLSLSLSLDMSRLKGVELSEHILFAMSPRWILVQNKLR
jgi:hypothetical protein